MRYHFKFFLFFSSFTFKFLLRKGFTKINVLDIKDLSSEDVFGGVNISDIFNLISPQAERINFLKKIAEIIPRQGCVMISSVRKRCSLPRDKFLSLKWKLYGVFLNNNDLPEEGDMVEDGKYNCHGFTSEELDLEVKKAGFKIVDFGNSRNFYNLVLEKCKND